MEKKYFRQYLQYNICVTIDNGINTRVRKNSKSLASYRVILELTNRSLEKKKTIEKTTFLCICLAKYQTGYGGLKIENTYHLFGFIAYLIVYYIVETRKGLKPVF